MHFVEQKYRDLVIQYLSGECTPEETEDLINWIQSNDDNFHYFIEVKGLWEAADNEEEVANFDIENSWKVFKKRLDTVDKKAGKTITMRPFYSSLKYVAGIAAAVLISFFIWNTVTPEKELPTQMIASNDSSEDLLLPDGTIAKLNYHSAIYFPQKFDGDLRKVKVEGEVYFDVVHNADKPFVVDCGDVMLEVKGTSFDIQKKPDSDQTIVIVTEGKVKVWETNNTDNYTYITKGESVRFSTVDNNFRSFNADKNFLSWKTRRLQFDNASLDTVLLTLEEHFRVDIHTHSDVDLNLPLSTQFDDNTLEETLDVIAMIFDLDYDITNGQVKIQNK